MHNVAKHLGSLCQCDVCDQCFNTKDDLETHIVKRNHNNEKVNELQKKNELQKRLNELNSKVGNQKMKIYDDILLLKQREEKENRKCKCKGSFCRVNHHKHRWMM